jgi:hypothetical protein
VIVVTPANQLFRGCVTLGTKGTPDR